MNTAEALYTLIRKRRTVRLFKNKRISSVVMKKIIDCARVAPSAANLQFLEYLVVERPDLRARVFPHTKWAGYIYPRRVPPPSARPAAYIIVLINRNKSKKPDLRDVGVAAGCILFSLAAFGLGGCWIASINKRKLRKILSIPADYQIDSLIACGYPDEDPVLEQKSDTVRYWLDKHNRLHVPKRPLKEILHYTSFVLRK